ncbi:MAG TPA: CHASE3 domain-containing protein, partial [Bacteroidales bacterium]|nr:CHASE3 domain-containing protein [Bacteroidales bacterium]
MKSVDSYITSRASLAENIFTLAGIMVLISGLLVVFGWQNNIAYLETFRFGPVPMKANLGAGFFFIGLNIILLRFRNKRILLFARIISVLISVVGFITVMEFIFGIEHGFDELLFRRTFLAGDYTGSTRMALNAAISLVFSGVVLYYIAVPEIKHSFFIIFSLVFTFSISLLGFLGFMLGMASFTGTTGYRDMAVLATVLFMLVSGAETVVILGRGKIKPSTEHKLFAGLVLVGTATIFLTLLSLSGFMSVRKVSNNVVATQEIKNNINEILGEVIDVETGVRGYLISGDRRYLEPMTNALPKIDNSLDTLHFYIENNQLQHLYFHRLQAFVLNRVDHADSLVRIFDTRGRDSAVAYFMSGRGKVVTDRIRSMIDSLRTEENRQLFNTNATESKHSNQAQMIAYINLPLLLLLLIIIFIFIRRNIDQRRKALDEVTVLNDRLESRVKERTASLSRNEERFRSTLDNMLEGCQIISYDYKYLYANREVEKQARNTVSGLLGKSMTEIYPGIENTEMFGNLKRCMEKRQQHLMLNEFTYPDGSTGWFELNMQPVPEGLVIFSQDITAKKMAENSLKESEEKFRSITENSADAIFITDYNGKYLFVNKESEKLLGYSQQEILSMTIANLSPAGMEKDHIMAFSKVLEKGKFRTEIGLLTKDGRTVYT